MTSDPSLNTYLIVLPLAAAATLILLGLGALLIWIAGASFSLVLRAWRPFHPITPEEEID